MGRVGALSAGVGSYNVVYGYTAFGTGWGDTVGAKNLFNLGDRDRMDNTVTYVTPNPVRSERKQARRFRWCRCLDLGR